MAKHKLIEAQKEKLIRAKREKRFDLVYKEMKRIVQHDTFVDIPEKNDEDTTSSDESEEEEVQE